MAIAERGDGEMARPEVSVLEVRVEAPQLEFLEKRAKELGLSKEGLVKWYIVSDMVKAIDAAREKNKTKKKRFSLQGIVSAGTVTDEDIEEAKKIWQPRTSL
jgi:hypothetical protein